MITSVLGIVLVTFLMLGLVRSRTPRHHERADPARVQQLEQELSVPLGDLISAAEEKAYARPSPSPCIPPGSSAGGLLYPGAAASFTACSGGATPGSVSVTYYGAGGSNVTHYSGGSYEDGRRKGMARIREINHENPIGGKDDAADDR